MRILVIGAYGLIGSYVTAALLAAGHEATGAGRDLDLARRRWPGLSWRKAELGVTQVETWREVLAGMDAVVNCAGALQDGARDDLARVHVRGVRDLAAACEAEGVRRLVHVSAAGLGDGSMSAFARTKLQGEAVLRASALDWVILRPGLVLAPGAYGGTALLRGLAAFPLVIPAAYAASRVQTVAVDDLARVVLAALAADAPSRITVDVVAPRAVGLGELLTAARGWLGLRPAPILPMPGALARLTGLCADALAWLGWRSPMRSTSLAQLAAGVTGDPGQAEQAFRVRTRSLEAMLAAWPSSVQERWFARLYFAKPLMLATLAAFWTASGVIGQLRLDAAAGVLVTAGVSETPARLAALIGGLADILLGLTVCVRRTAPWALRGMIALTLAYLAGASLWRPDLWADPMGPLVKAAATMVLALAALAVMDER
jgi:uncharacterized protein YbjT (DUF2867 family)